MAELWNDFWWAIVLFVLVAAGGGLRFTRNKSQK